MLTYEDIRNLVNGPASSAAAVDISAADAALSPPSRRLWIGGTGDVKVDMVDSGAAVTFKAVPVGWLDVRASKVYKTGTTATNLISVFDKN